MSRCGIGAPRRPLHRPPKCGTLRRVRLTAHRRSEMNGRTAAAVAFIAAAASLGLAAPASASRVYGGQPVSKRLQVVLDVSDDGARLQSVSFLLDLPCSRSDRTLEMGTTTAVAELPAQPAAGSRLLAGGTIASGRLNATLMTG